MNRVNYQRVMTLDNDSKEIAKISQFRYSCVLAFLLIAIGIIMYFVYSSTPQDVSSEDNVVAHSTTFDQDDVLRSYMDEDMIDQQDEDINKLLDEETISPLPSLLVTEKTISPSLPILETYFEPESYQNVEGQIKEFQKRCPNWSSDFTQKYIKECLYWDEIMQKWQQSIRSNSKTMLYSCTNEQICHGWGDRTAGILSVFLKAIREKSFFHIHHNGLHRLFDPCLVQTKELNWAKIGNSPPEPRISCPFPDPTGCEEWLRATCGAGPMIMENSNRVCIKQEQCEKLVNRYEDLTPVNVIGCGLRAIFEPSELFYHKLRFPVKVGGEEEEEKMLNLAEIQDLFERYFVISIQLRLGDVASFADSKKFINEDDLRRAFRCALTVQSDLSSSTSNFQMIDGKKVKWFLATDSAFLKKLAEKEFGEQLIIIDMRPVHISKDGDRDELADTIAEWYVLGLGNLLIANKFGGGDMFTGRVSGFSKSSWIYQLKHMVYDAGKCVRYSLPYDGTWMDIRPTVCHYKSKMFREHVQFEQPHLELLKKHNLSFPFAWIENGKMFTHRRNSPDSPNEVKNSFVRSDKIEKNLTNATEIRSVNHG